MIPKRLHDRLRPNQGELSTVAVHGGEARNKPGHAMADAIFCTSTYTFPDSKAIVEYLEHEESRHDEKVCPKSREEYGRYGNPSEAVVEAKLAALEGGEDALLYSSGMAAISGFLLASVKAGDEVVLFDECYHRTREFCQTVLGKFGVTTHVVPTCNYEAMAEAINDRTRLLISESPTNPHLSVVDLDRFAALGQAHGVDTLIDATLATPVNSRPLAQGVDFVIHSCTKYLGGHNDLLAGVVIGSRQGLAPARHLRGVTGMINAPHAIFLLQRGLKTLELRMTRHNANGLAVARFLEDHPRVERVYYPGLPSHRDYEVAQRTMGGHGGLVTFLIRHADEEETASIIDRLRLPRIGPSLGGVESLVEQPSLMSYYSQPREKRLALGIPDNMIRLSCGIENTADLIDDLRQALAG